MLTIVQPIFAFLVVAPLLSGTIPVKYGRGTEEFSFQATNNYGVPAPPTACCTARPLRIYKNTNIWSLLLLSNEADIKHNSKARLKDWCIQMMKDSVIWFWVWWGKASQGPSHFIHSVNSVNMYWVPATCQALPGTQQPPVQTKPLDFMEHSTELTLKQNLQGWMNVCYGGWW